MMNIQKRKLLKTIPVLGVTGLVWKKPVINTVLLPAHAVTTRTTLTCFQSSDAEGMNLIAENANWGDIYYIHVTNDPPAPNAPFTWDALCDGVEAFPVQNYAFDENGEAFITVTAFDNFCSQEDPEIGTIIGHRFFFGDSNPVTCNIVYSG